MKSAIAGAICAVSLWAAADFAGRLRSSEPEPRIPPARRALSIEELIVRESVAAQMPPDLALTLAWEESRLDPFALRHETNGSWSWGIFQINAKTPVFDLDVHRQVHDGVTIAAYWWALTKDRKRAKRAFRRGRL